MNKLSSNLRSLSPLPGRSPQREAPSLDHFQRQSECSPQESGLRWATVSLAGLGVLAATTGMVQAQIQHQQPLVVAHRGETDHARENSIEAFRQALEDGADGLELDIHLTSDGDLAVIHDDTLDRTYGRPGVVREMTSEELRAAGVPMLSDVLALPADKLIIEIKHPKGGRHVGIEQIVIDQLERAGAEDRSVVISFDETSLKTLHQLEPELATGYLYGGDQVDPAQAKEELGILYLGPHFSVVNEEYMRKAHEAGLKVNVWTVDELKDMERMVQLGCDAITTDSSGNLVQLLSDR